MALPQLARMAQVNDKRAQHELAERSAAGCGMRPDLRRAGRLLLRAKSPIGGETRTYLPNDEGGKIARTESLETKVVAVGYAPAEARLNELRSGLFNPLPMSNWSTALCSGQEEAR